MSPITKYLKGLKFEVTYDLCM